MKCLPLLLLCLSLHAGETLLEPARRAEIERRHADRRAELFSEYRKRLDERFRTSETAGDIDLMVLIADERDAPGEGDTPPELLAERDFLAAGLLQLERHRLWELRNDLIELRVTPPQNQPEAFDAAIRSLNEQLAAPRTGPNILPEDLFAPARRMEWQILMPRGRTENRTGPRTDGEPPVLRLHQDERHPLLLTRPQLLLPGAEYQLHWEARSLGAPADATDTEDGAYAIGFGVSDRLRQSLPPSRQAQLTRTVLHIAPAPKSDQWQAVQGQLQTLEHMDQLVLRISSGAGEWEIRNLRIQRLYTDSP